MITYVIYQENVPVYSRVGIEFEKALVYFLYQNLNCLNLKTTLVNIIAQYYLIFVKTIVFETLSQVSRKLLT